MVATRMSATQAIATTETTDSSDLVIYIPGMFAGYQGEAPERLVDALADHLAKSKARCGITGSPPGQAKESGRPVSTWI
jgi:hypothetical protein